MNAQIAHIEDADIPLLEPPKSDGQFDQAQWGGQVATAFNWLARHVIASGRAHEVRLIELDETLTQFSRKLVHIDECVDAAKESASDAKVTATETHDAIKILIKRDRERNKWSPFWRAMAMNRYAILIGTCIVGSLLIKFIGHVPIHEQFDMVKTVWQLI